MFPPGGASLNRNSFEGVSMQVDEALVKRIAHLARIRVREEDLAHLKGELTSILAFVEQLGEVDTSGVAPMTSSIEMQMKKRQDVVSDGGCADDIVGNAPERGDHFFLVPKVVE